MRPLVFAVLFSMISPAFAQEVDPAPGAETAAPAEAAPAAEPAPATEAPAPTPAPREEAAPAESGWGDEEEFEKPSSPRRRDRDEPEELPKGNDAAAGIVAGLAAGLSAPLIGCVGSLCGPFSFLVVGAGMGAVGWMLGSLSGAKRIPMVPVLAAGIIGAGLTTLAALPAYLVIAAGAVLTLYADATVGSAVTSVGYLISGVVGLVGIIGTAVAIGVVAAQMGRGLVEGESALAFDMTNVPPPEDEEEDEDEEDDRPRKKKVADDDEEEEDDDRPRKKNKKAAEDDEEEDEDEEDERPRKRKARAADDEEEDEF